MRKENTKAVTRHGIFWNTAFFHIVREKFGALLESKTALLEDTHHHPLSSMLPWFASVPTAHPLLFLMIYLSFLLSFRFFSMGPLQDSPFYKHDWLPSTTSERKLQTTFSSLVQVSPHATLCSIWCGPPHTPGNTPYLAPHATLSPFCTCPMEATLAKSYSIFCLFTAEFFKALLMPTFSLYTL